MSNAPRTFPSRPQANSAPPPTTTTARPPQQESGRTGGFKRVGAGWNSESKDGTKQFIKAKLDDGTVLYIFLNDKKRNEKDPDYSISMKEG